MLFLYGEFGNPVRMKKRLNPGQITGDILSRVLRSGGARTARAEERTRVVEIRSHRIRYSMVFNY